jgi:hypothetical protein
MKSNKTNIFKNLQKMKLNKLEVNLKISLLILMILSI